MNSVPEQLPTTSVPNGISGARPPRTPIDPPSYRKLRVYTYDPSTKTQLETALINETTLRVSWEGRSLALTAALTEFDGLVLDSSDDKLYVEYRVEPWCLNARPAAESAIPGEVENQRRIL